jgi:uncharacterized glyoxalase superfamily protein PhnB
MLLGLRTAIYRTPDLAQGKLWYTKALGLAPYFDQPDATQNTVGAYWGVNGIDAVYARLLELGATPRTEVTDVGDGIRIGAVLDPFGNVLGIIENLHFKVTP